MCVINQIVNVQFVDTTSTLFNTFLIIFNHVLPFWAAALKGLIIFASTHREIPAARLKLQPQGSNPSILAQISLEAQITALRLK